MTAAPVLPGALPGSTRGQPPGQSSGRFRVRPPGRAQDRHDFPLLDGARFMVALAVVGFHAVASMHIPALCEFAFLGVDFFFLLSGFVIGHAYQARLEAGGYLRRFAVVRLVRLYPMILLGTLIGVLVRAPAAPSPGDLLLGLAMVPRTWGAPGSLVFPLDPALWSLFFELFANLVFALLAARARARTLLAVCLVSLPLVVWGRSLHVGWETTSFLYGFPRTAFSFALGLLLHRLHAAGRLPDLKRAAPFALPALVAVLVLPLPMSHGRFPILLAYVAVLFPGVVVALASARPGPRVARLCRIAGEASYPLYAVHVPIVQAVGAAMLAAHATMPARLATALGLIAAMALLGLAVARWIDAPVRAWLSARVLPRPRPVAAVAPGV